MTKREDVEAAVAEIEAELGPIDVLVNNAGVVRDKRIEKMDDEDWDIVIATNLRSQFLTCRAVLPGMARTRLRPRHQHLVARVARRFRPGQLFGGQRAASSA